MAVLSFETGLYSYFCWQEDGIICISNLSTKLSKGLLQNIHLWNTVQCLSYSTWDMVPGINQGCLQTCRVWLWQVRDLRYDWDYPTNSYLCHDTEDANSSLFLLCFSPVIFLRVKNRQWEQKGSREGCHRSVLSFYLGCGFNRKTTLSELLLSVALILCICEMVLIWRSMRTSAIPYRPAWFNVSSLKLPALKDICTLF